MGSYNAQNGRCELRPSDWAVRTIRHELLNECVMETREELLAMGTYLMESFVSIPDRFLSSIFRRYVEGSEKYVGSKEQYYLFMKKVHNYIVDNQIKPSEDFEIHCRKSPNSKSLRTALDILNTYK